MIALGSDQAGYELKQVVMRHLEKRGLSYKDYGSYSPDPVDYPVYGKKVAHAIVDGAVSYTHLTLPTIRLV